MNILVINGPNLNLLGIREPDLYGKEDYAALVALVEDTCAQEGIGVEVFQSNHEGAIVDKIQQALGTFDGIVINPAAYTHTSVAILDALKAVQIPAVEVHISDVSKREDFRQVSYARLPEDLHGVGAGRVPPRHSLPERIPLLPSVMGEIGPLSPARQRRRRQGPFFTFFSGGRADPVPEGGVGNGGAGPCPLTNRWGPAMLKIEHMFYFWTRKIPWNGGLLRERSLGKQKIPPTQTSGLEGWWRRMDSNHRSRRQQIYSLPPLATRELLRMKLELVDGLEPPTC